MNHLQIGHLYAFASACFGTVFFTCYDRIVDDIEIIQFVFLLFTFSLCFNSLLALKQRKNLKINKQTLWIALAFTLLSIFGNYANGLALKQLHPAITVVLQRTQIFFVIALTIVFLKQKVPIKILIGAAMALSGIVLIQNKTNPDWDFQNTGILWGLSTALFFGSAQVLVKHFINDVTPTVINVIRLVMALIILSLNPILWESWQSLNQFQWIMILICAFVGPTCSRLCLFYALQTITAAETVLISMLTPFFLLIVMILFFNQGISTQEMWGGLILLIGIIYANFSRS